MTTLVVDQPVQKIRATHDRVPMSRLVGVELRKMFDTRSGFWLMASIVITALVATGAVILFAPTATSPTTPSRRRSGSR